ncbi:MAG: VOC family protein [Chitinophagaceae bacterium]|nr:MAG: VOC family protein [Chitinophagaceae bacterium]
MRLVPYIMFNGNCEEALNFYAKALGGQIQGLQYFEGAPVDTKPEDAKKVMHAQFSAGDLFLMASDGQQNEAVGGMVHLSLDFPSQEEIGATFAALSEGARITMPLQDTFWGARFGMLTDQFGVSWMFNYDKPKN